MLTRISGSGFLDPSICIPTHDQRSFNSIVEPRVAIDASLKLHGEHQDIDLESSNMAMAATGPALFFCHLFCHELPACAATLQLGTSTGQIQADKPNTFIRSSEYRRITGWRNHGIPAAESGPIVWLGSVHRFPDTEHALPAVGGS
jgi:hypothetical protein